LVFVANNRETQRLVQTVLQPRQVRVVCTADDEQTIAAARTERPDLIVAYLGSSQTEGLAVAQRLKTDAATAAIPVLAITRHPSVDLQERAESAGFDALLIEPSAERRSPTSRACSSNVPPCCGNDPIGCGGLTLMWHPHS
jgi:two-component system cell cycle response regulator DivK